MPHFDDQRHFHAALASIDRLTSEACREIAAISTLALHSLQTPAGRRRLDLLATALSAIKSRAETTANAVAVDARDARLHQSEAAARLRR